MLWTKRRIRIRAEQVLQEHGVQAPPIPVERLARQLGAELRYEPFQGDLSGMLFREHDRVIIGVNALHPKTRQRFTIAHELGHLLLDSDRLHVDEHFPVWTRDAVSSQATQPEEVAANAFAADLLMPADLLASDLAGCKEGLDYDDDEALRQLSERYQVSLQALLIRLTSLGLLRETNELPR